MNTELSFGTTIKTTYGEEWTIQDKLGEGGQGYVYRIEKNGVKKALKWYKPRAINEEFKEHIRMSIMNGTPSNGFIWPTDIVESGETGFGYIMELKPENYCDMTDILCQNRKFTSFRRVVDAAMHIVSEMRVLHNKGYSYQDLNDGNFFIDPVRGRILVCDNDNVTINGKSTGVLGKPRYMAPEIVRGNNMPDICSDRFSMALIIFRLITLGHPLEGIRSTGEMLTPDLQMVLYGTDPVFIFDPEDTRNRPDPEIHQNEIAIWSCLPQYMKDIFIKAFGKSGLMQPIHRPTEVEWIDALVRFRSDIVSCSCGSEVFVQEDGKAVCDCCGRLISIPNWLELPEYRIPGTRDSRIYQCQTCITDVEDALEPIGRVIMAKGQPEKLGIRNMSSNQWDAITSKGKQRSVQPNEVIPLKDGIQFTVNESTIHIRGGK